MHIRKLTAYVVRLPLKRAFAHATATRDDTENVLVRCELACGTVGWGEGVPRSYVTGETPLGCLQQLTATNLHEQLGRDCDDWQAVVDLCENFRPVEIADDPRGCYGNALRCAVELSILDAFGRQYAEPVSSVVKQIAVVGSIYGPRDVVQYGAVIDAGSRALPRKALVRRLYGFRNCKVKVGSPGDDDAARLNTIRNWIGPRVDLHVDANGAWRAETAAQKLAALLPARISCVEQPVAHEEFSALAELRRQVPVPVMLDESLTGEIDARAAIAANACDLFNIRLSKCGGLLASVRLAAIAHRAGIGYQLGCHPGETGILSAAGRHWAANVANIRYVEGSYDRLLFRRLITREDMTFGYGGKAAALTAPGLGVTIDTVALSESITAQQEFEIA